MSHEFPHNPELVSLQFQQFIDDHTDVVLGAESEEPEVTRKATWEVSDGSQIVSIDKVQFKVSIDLGERTMYHAMLFTRRDQAVLWVGYDSGANTFSALIGSDTADTDITFGEVTRILDELAHQERDGKLHK